MIADNTPVGDSLFPDWAGSGAKPKKRRTYASPSYQTNVGARTEKNTSGYKGRNAPPTSAAKPKGGSGGHPVLKVRGYGALKTAVAPKPKYTKPKSAPAAKSPGSAPAVNRSLSAASSGPAAGDPYAPLFAALSAQRSNISSTALADAGRQRAWAAEIAKQLAPTAQTISQIYGSAANDDSTFAKGFSDGMQHALGQSKDQVNQILQNNGAPAGQMQSQQPITDTGDVLYGLGGYLPASTLEKQGAAFASAAAFLPNEALGRGQAAAADVMAQARKDLLGVDQQQYDLMSKQAQSKIDQQAAQAEAALKQQALDQENRQWNATYGLNVAKAQSSQTLAQRRIAQGNARLKAQQKQYQTANQLAFARIYGRDPATGQPTLAAVKAAKTEQKNKKAAAKLTPYQRARLSGTAAQIADSAYHGFTETVDVYDPNVGKKVPKEVSHPAIGYQQAITEAMKEGIPLRQILPALDRYYKKGERGRPMQSIYQRRAAAKRK